MTMRDYQVTYSPQAYEDLLDIYRYIAHGLKAPSTAKAQVHRIEKAVLGLKSLPWRHEAVNWEPWASIGMRRLGIDNYLVFYRVSDERGSVEVVRVLYAGMDVREIAVRDAAGNL